MKVKKKSKKLLLQIGLVLMPVFVLLLLGALWIMYTTTVDGFLEAQNTNMELRLTKTSDSVVKLVFGDDALRKWCIEQWEKDPALCRENVTEEEYDKYRAFMESYDGFVGTMDYVNKMPAEVQKTYLKTKHFDLVELFKNEAENNKYDQLFLIDVDQQYFGRVQCFGNFEVFTPGGEHVRFERSKAKEMFAYLVHKRGSSCTAREIFAAMYEDEPYDEKQQNLMQTYTYALKKSLKNVGAEAALVHTYNAFAVNPDVLDCDYYRFCELDSGAVNAYQNEYMSQYYWADFLFDEDLY